MLPTGIFGFYSNDGEELRHAGEELRARCGEGEEVLACLSADGHLLLGCVISTTYPYPAILSASQDGSSIGVFDGVLFETGVLSSQPERLAVMREQEISSAANGMFLAASYREGTLRLLSDPFATLPLYYCGHSGRFAFTTSRYMLHWWYELRDVLRQDETGMAQYLSFGRTLGGRTTQAGINRIGGATVVEVDCLADCTKQRSARYYQPEIRPAEYPGLERDIVDAFRAAVLALVDAPGHTSIAALTGGLDSRTIAAVLHAEKRDVTVVTHYTQEGHDIALAREAARRLQLRHVAERLPGHFDLAAEREDFIAAGNGILPFNNIHASEVHRRYAFHGTQMLDGNHTSIEGRWFLRNSAGKVRTPDSFLHATVEIILRSGVLAFTRDAEAQSRLAIASLEDLIPDLRQYASPGCAADVLYVQHLLPQHDTDLAAMQNRFLRYVSPYYDRRYVDLIARMSERKRWMQRPQNLVIAACAPQLRGMARSYADVLSLPTDHPWLLRAPVAFERVYDHIGLSRWPRLHAAVSRRRPSVVYDIRLPDDPDIFSIDDTIFDAARIRGLLTDNGPVLRDPTLVRLLQHILR
jgi:hypothetical protein